MNVKLQEQDLKFKISADELNMLLSGQEIQFEISLPDASYHVLIQSNDTENNLSIDMNVESNHSILTLHAPLKILQNLQDMGRSRDGMTVQYGDISLTLQVDLRADKPHQHNGAR